MENHEPDLNDPGVIATQLQFWAGAAWRNGFEHWRITNPEAADRCILAHQNGHATVSALLDMEQGTAAFFLNLDTGEALELFRSVPAPRMTTQ